jgi:predicted phage tail protein
VLFSLLLVWLLGISQVELFQPRDMVQKLGAAMMLGGVVQMLSPQPAGLASKQSADNRASYAFGGVTNTAAQGYPVPLLYGRRR